jgi:hypothetical protein
MSYNLSNKILLLNLDENKETFNVEKERGLGRLFVDIDKLDPYLIIVTSQNSLSSTNNHFQNSFREELMKANVWLCLSKIDAIKPIHSSSIISTFSGFFKSNNDQYNVRTIIYYRIDKVCLLFENENLNKKSSFNHYNSNHNSTPKGNCKSDIIIENYYMAKYSDDSKKGHGKITIGLIFKFANNYYKLIISNRCNINNSKLAKIEGKRMDKSSIYIVSPNDITEATDNNFKINIINLRFNKKKKIFNIDTNILKKELVEKNI